MELGAAMALAALGTKKKGRRDGSVSEGLPRSALLGIYSRRSGNGRRIFRAHDLCNCGGKCGNCNPRCGALSATVAIAAKNPDAQEIVLCQRETLEWVH